jgi:hypothetical protein
MKMRNVLSGLAVALFLSPSAHAGFVFSYTVMPGAGALAGKDIFKFYARNDQTGEQLGTKALLASDIHFKTAGQPLYFDFRDMDNDERDDANVAGLGMDENTVTGTFMRYGTYNDWQPGFISPSGNRGTATSDARIKYANVTDFNVASFSLNKALDATQGLGRFYGAAVVPAGTDVNVFGRVAAEAGGVVGTGAAPLEAAGIDSSFIADTATTSLLAAEAAASVEQGAFFNFNFTATAAPEPGTIGVLGLAGTLMMARRRARRR